MQFNTYLFVLGFLPLCAAVFYAAVRWAGDRAATVWLIVASVGFYAWWNPAYLPLLLASIVVNYGCGLWLAKRAGLRKTLLTLGVGFNLGLLGYFKYAGFLVRTASALGGTELSFAGVALPLAISFYTFQQVAFLVDVYRDRTVLPDPLRYALFVCFFPQLIAGPIVSHREVVPQFAEGWGRRVPWGMVAPGLTLFAAGLFKKVILADHFATLADPSFAVAAAGGAVGTVDAWIGASAYTLQLYFDFSAYSDMAIGLGGLFGITLPVNFDSPYRSVNVAEFWRRWHITLGRFIRDYLYFPLGGSRRGEARTLANLFAVMLLCGLWHGAGWAFVVWGGLHGLGLCAVRLWGRRTDRADGSPLLPRPVAWGLTFGFVVFGWVLFRAEDLGVAANFLAAMAGVTDAASSLIELDDAVVLLPGLLVCLALPNAVRWVHGDLTGWAGRFAWRPHPAFAAGTAVLLYAAVLNLGRVSEFLYFNF